mgnify:CR=1 FL=1|jgi:uncharacterized protein YggE
MKNLIYLSLFIVSISSSFAQNNSSTLKINGSAIISVKPTQTVVTFNISEIRMSYSESIAKLTERVDLLSKSLLKLGFNTTDITTSNFDIRQNIIYNRGQQKDSGYVTSQTLQVVFEQSKEKLLSVLNNTANSRANSSISISFQLDNESKSILRDQLIVLAVKDARNKADLIADASLYKVTGIKEIQYGMNNTIAYDKSAMYRTASMQLEDVSISNFEAANLSFNENVYIEYYIENK